MSDEKEQSSNKKQETFASITSNRFSLIDGSSAQRLKNKTETKKLSKNERIVAKVEAKYLSKEISYPTKTNFDKLFVLLSRAQKSISVLDSAGVQLGQIFDASAGFAPLKSTKSYKNIHEQLKLFFVNLEVLGSFDSLDSENIIDYTATRHNALR